MVFSKSWTGRIFFTSSFIVSYLLISFLWMGSLALGDNMKEERSNKIVNVFNGLNPNTMDLLKDFYHSDIVFQDPLGTIKGLDNLRAYYENMYENVIEIRFDFHNEVIQDDTHVVTWTMVLRAEKLNGGEPTELEGNSWIQFEPQTSLVRYHRDYFDMGEFLYEHIPVLGFFVKQIKSRLSTH